MGKKKSFLLVAVLIISALGIFVAFSIKFHVLSILNTQGSKKEFQHVVEQLKQSKTIKDIDTAQSLYFTSRAFYELVEVLDSAEPKKYSNDDIERISPDIKVFTGGDYRLISYIQSQEDFGRSSRGSWKILQNTRLNHCFMIDENTTLDITDFRVIVIGGVQTVYIAGNNYETNSNKVYIYGYQVINNELKKFNALDFANIDISIWGINPAKGWIYSANGEPISSRISSDWKELIIESANSSSGDAKQLIFVMSQDGYFKR